MNDSKKITVFGATGKVGRELLQLLSQAAVHTIAVTRHTRKASLCLLLNAYWQTWPTKKALQKQWETAVYFFSLGH